MDQTFKKGDIVRFAELTPDDKPEDRYEVIDVALNNAFTYIRMLNTPLTIAPINQVLTTSLILAQ